MTLWSATSRLVVLGLVIAWAAPVRADEKSVHLVLLHVNDVHGQLESRMVNGQSVGGYARLASAVEEIRGQRGADRVFLLHAGDEFCAGIGCVR